MLEESRMAQKNKTPPALLAMERVTLLPHMGSATAETRLRMALLACENLLTALRGQPPPNLVNRRRSSGEPLDRGSFAIEI